MMSRTYLEMKLCGEKRSCLICTNCAWLPIMGLLSIPQRSWRTYSTSKVYSHRSFTYLVVLFCPFSLLSFSRDPATHETSHEQQRTAAGLLAAVTRKLWRTPPISWSVPWPVQAFSLLRLTAVRSRVCIVMTIFPHYFTFRW